MDANVRCCNNHGSHLPAGAAVLAGAAALAEVLPTCCPNLRMLRLDNNNIGSAGVECLCHGIARAKVGGSLSIEKIFLARNPLDVNDRAEWLGCCEAMGVATDVQLMQPVIE